MRSTKRGLFIFYVFLALPVPAPLAKTIASERHLPVKQQQSPSA